jgi:hypothetical protein
MNNKKPKNAVELIGARLAQINVFAGPPAKSEAELFMRGGAMFASTAANVVAAISTDRRLDRSKAKQKAGSEALEFAAMADLCLARAAMLAAKQPE